MQGRCTRLAICLALLASTLVSTPIHAHGGDRNSASHSLADARLAELARRRETETPLWRRMEKLIASALNTAAAADAGLPALYGEWSTVIAWPHVFVSAAGLPDGRVLTWGADEARTFRSGSRTMATVWDPDTGQFLASHHESHSMFCAVPTMLENGQVFVNGGDGTRERTSTFDFRTNTWNLRQNMNVGRWYPGSVALPSGQVFTALGVPGSDYPEIWTANQGWAYLNGASLRGPILDFPAYENDMFPYLHLGPDGRLFHSGPTPQMNWIDPHGSGSVVAAGLSNTWYSKYAAGIMFDEGKILVAGGQQTKDALTATAQAMMLDINAATPLKTNITSMANARRFSNGVVLPDGEVLVIGGNTGGREFDDDGSIMTPELWDPVTRTWREVADISVPRNYHSVALLLPDGRVFAGGGGLCNCAADHPDAQLYSPPYLFNTDGTSAIRPEIREAPAVISYGQDVNVTATAGVARFTLIKMSATTHNYNSDLRFLNVPFSEYAPGRYELRMHRNRNVMTPGYWMLFALNAQGVPSVAKVVNVSTNDAPVLVQPSAQNTMRNSAVHMGISAHDPNGDTLSFSAIGLPSGLTIDSRTGVISGVVNTEGGYRVEVTVSDGTYHAAASFVWTVSVADSGTGNHAPIVTVPANQLSTVGTVSQLQMHANDPDGDALNFTATGLPTGINLNSVTGLLQGAPAVPGEFAVTVSVADGNGAVGSASFTWIVQAPPLVLDPVTTQPRPVNTNISYMATARHALGTASYKWHFGDAGQETAYSSERTISHTFAQPGLYVVRVTATDSRGVAQSQSFVQAVHAPTTQDRPKHSSNITLESRSNASARLWVINQDNNSVSVFDTGSHAKLKEIETGIAPRSVAIAPDGKIWISNKHSATLSIIDPVGLSVVETVSLPRASQPYGLVFSPTGNAAYLALEATGKVLKLDPVHGAIAGQVDVGDHIRQLAVTADGARILASRFITPALPGEHSEYVRTNQANVYFGAEVIAVETATMARNTTVILRHSDKVDTENQGRGVPNYLGAAVIAPDGQSAWVPSKQDNIKRGLLRDGNQLNFQNTVRAITSRLDLNTLTEDYAARLDHDNAGVASAGVFDPNGSYLYVALETNRQVVVIDPYGQREVTRFSVGRAPQGLSISADGHTLYVNNFMDRTVSVHDLSGLLSSGNSAIPIVRTLTSVTSEALGAQVLRGKQLFYDAQDTRLAQDSYISCAACHNDGGHDGRTWDLTGFGEGLRNTIGLNGHGGMAHGFLHWSANFDEVQDFEAQIRRLAGGTGLMSDTDFSATEAALGNPKAGRSVDLDALAAYVASLTLAPASPYRTGDGRLTVTAEAGKTVFATAQCGSCHAGNRFTDSAAALLHNVGTVKPHSGQRLGTTLSGLDTPSLRGAWATAPYLHDGSAATLDQAIRAHAGVALSDGDIERLVSYISQIEGDEVAAIGPPPPVLTVNLTGPGSGASYPAGTPIVLTAAASATNGSIGKVEFYAGTTLLGTDDTAPYTLTWTFPGPGPQSLTAKAYATQGGTAQSQAIAITVSAATQTGTGLLGQYFNNPGLSGSPVLQRIEALNFSWPGSGPGGDVNRNNVSVRWSGRVEVPVNGSYRFRTRSDNSLRLWIDGKLLIDRWDNHDLTIDTTTAIKLLSGKRYQVVIEFRLHRDAANLNLAWRLPGTQAYATVPSEWLYPDRNLASGQAASQSSTADSDAHPVAEKAVDGNVSGSSEQNSFTRTQRQRNAWWQVDLGRRTHVNAIQIWQRSSCCAARIANLQVFVSNTDMTGRRFASLKNDKQIWSYQPGADAARKLLVPTNVRGRYVRVQLTGTGSLSLAEVQVFGGD